MPGEKVSVVVPTRDRGELLERLLASLRAQTLPAAEFEVVVVDDGSTDSTPEVLERAASRAPNVRVVREQGRGRAAARNTGWRLAAAPLVAFTDDDCVATPAWLERLLDAAEASPGEIIQGLTDIDPAEEDSVGAYSRTLVIREPGPYYETCNILYPREVLERLDGFSESYLRAEDTDLGWRARKAGIDCAFARDAVVYHAVVQLGPVGKLRWALEWSSAMQVLGSHPELRSTLVWGLFWKRTHALLALALVGALLARRFPPALALALPYARMLRARCIADGKGPAHAAYLTLYDATETAAAARGAVEHRVLIL